MGMDPGSIALLGMAGGQLLGDFGAGKSANDARAQQQAWMNMILGRSNALQWGNSAAMDAQQRFMQNLPQFQKYQNQNIDPSLIDVNKVMGAPGMNAGNDALMQMLRANPSVQMNAQTTDQLQEMLKTGDPFDTSKMFSALQGQDQRMTQQALGQLTGGATSLGQRFGSSMMKQQSDLLGNITGQLDARNAGIQQSSYADAMNRRLQAAGQLTGREGMAMDYTNQNLARQLQAAGMLNTQGNTNAQLLAQMLGQNMGAQNQFSMFNQQQGLDTAKFNQDALMQMLGLQQGGISQMFGMEQGMRGYNAGLLQMLAGMGQPGQGQNWMQMLGGGMGDIGQMLFLRSILGGGKNA